MVRGCATTKVQPWQSVTPGEDGTNYRVVVTVTWAGPTARYTHRFVAVQSHRQCVFGEDVPDCCIRVATAVPVPGESSRACTGSPGRRAAQVRTQTGNVQRRFTASDHCGRCRRQRFFMEVIAIDGPPRSPTGTAYRRWASAHPSKNARRMRRSSRRVSLSLSPGSSLPRGEGVVGSRTTRRRWESTPHAVWPRSARRLTCGRSAHGIVRGVRWRGQT